MIYVTLGYTTLFWPTGIEENEASSFTMVLCPKAKPTKWHYSSSTSSNRIPRMKIIPMLENSTKRVNLLYLLAKRLREVMPTADTAKMTDPIPTLMAAAAKTPTR